MTAMIIRLMVGLATAVLVLAVGTGGGSAGRCALYSRSQTRNSTRNWRSGERSGSVKGGAVLRSREAPTDLHIDDEITNSNVVAA
jgi:hypothetical protein